jgi:hypothetical protein
MRYVHSTFTHSRTAAVTGQEPLNHRVERVRMDHHRVLAQHLGHHLALVEHGHEGVREIVRIQELRREILVDFGEDRSALFHKRFHAGIIRPRAILAAVVALLVSPTLELRQTQLVSLLEVRTRTGFGSFVPSRRERRADAVAGARAEVHVCGRRARPEDIEPDLGELLVAAPVTVFVILVLSAFQVYIVLRNNYLCARTERCDGQAG